MTLSLLFHKVLSLRGFFTVSKLIADYLKLVSTFVKLAVTLPAFQQIIFPCHSQPELLGSFMKDSLFCLDIYNKTISW